MGTNQARGMLLRHGVGPDVGGRFATAGVVRPIHSAFPGLCGRIGVFGAVAKW